MRQKARNNCSGHRGLRRKMSRKNSAGCPGMDPKTLLYV